jgi:hypothetical protein
MLDTRTNCLVPASARKTFTGALSAVIENSALAVLPAAAYIDTRESGVKRSDLCICLAEAEPFQHIGAD